jgi:hypothetical protein
MCVCLCVFMCVYDCLCVWNFLSGLPTDTIRACVCWGWASSRYWNYGVDDIFGIRMGYRGFYEKQFMPYMRLTPTVVDGISELGGTILGSSRGGFDAVRASRVHTPSRHSSVLCTSHCHVRIPARICHPRVHQKKILDACQAAGINQGKCAATPLCVCVSVCVCVCVFVCVCVCVCLCVCVLCTPPFNMTHLFSLIFSHFAMCVWGIVAFLACNSVCDWRGWLSSRVWQSV